METSGRNHNERVQVECLSEDLSLCADSPQRKESHGLFVVFQLSSHVRFHFHLPHDSIFTTLGIVFSVSDEALSYLRPEKDS